MQRNTIESNAQIKPVRPKSHSRYKYKKVKDARKHPIRGLWLRNSTFLGRIKVETPDGRKKLQWVTLKAQTPAEAHDEYRVLLVERSENRLRQVGRSPTFADFLDNTYQTLLASSGKKPDTITTEKAHYKRWREGLGHLRLDKIRPSHVLEVLNKLRAERSARTSNLALVCLRHVLKAAKRDGWLKTMPTEDIAWQRVEKKSRRLYTRSDINLFCEASRVASKNGDQFADYLRLLALTGAREQEAVKLQWNDVSFDRQLLTIGADADTKNREARHIDFNPELAAHLKDMHARRAPDSQWVFPSPQRGDQDNRSKTFRESLLLARSISGWACKTCEKLGFGPEIPKACPYCQGTQLQPKKQALPAHFQTFGFHDCRHHFISFCVMSGIDFMTIARWVGHKDGGVLIGKVYGHLSNEHAQLQAKRLTFGPTLVSEASVSNA